MITGSIVGVAYITELFIAWYSGVEYEQYAFLNRATGPYWWAYWSMMTCNVFSPQFMWFKKLRTSIMFSFIISIVVNIGMWFERFVIIVTSLHRDYLPSSWTMFSPTFVDIGIFIGTIGFFFVLFLLYARTFPVIAQAEVKTILKSSEKHHIEEVYTPFPVHGLDKALGLEETRLAIMAFIYGCIGLCIATLMMNYIMIEDWPQNIGGKPSFSYLENMPAFVPIMFEMTVFFAAHLMVITFYMRSKLWPFKKAENPNPLTTDDKFLVEIELHDNEKELEKLLKKSGAIDVSIIEKPE